jgi:N-acetylmuramoyl-L-alanine amidase
MRKFYLVIVGLLVGILAFSGNCYAASYTVKPGDTLYKIAVNNGTTVDTLTSLNNLNSTMIYPGDVLQLPDSGQTPGSAQQYTVQPGDTLYLISKAYGTTVDAIMSQNNLSSTVIYPGQVLLIPGSGQAPPSSTAPTGATQQYTVQPGDTLYLISRAYCTTADAIMSQNNLSSTVIYPGQVLQVPDSGQAPSKSPPSTGSTQQYTVQPGDTLYLISRAYCTTVDAIMSQNNLSNTVIYPGQVLQLPVTEGIFNADSTKTKAATTPSSIFTSGFFSTVLLIDLNPTMTKGIASTPQITHHFSGRKPSMICMAWAVRGELIRTKNTPNINNNFLLRLDIFFQAGNTGITP